MRSTLVILGSFVAVALGQGLIINTPTPPPVQCQPTLLSWGGGVPPYFISIVDPDDKTDILVDFGQLTNTSLTWVDLLPAGTNMLLTIKDSTGAPQSSAPFSVGTGGSDTCLGGTNSASSTPASSGSKGASSTASAPPKSTSSTPVVSTPAVSTPSSTKPAATSSAPASGSGSASGSAPAPSQTGSALTNRVPAAAAAAALGAVFAALF
ncbi:hypothetical protein C8R46DRAFT_1094072 [Mycena filopes]|nr:hypothetical protein C8R46DRAFT_1094072 [Mycena filopes]